MQLDNRGVPLNALQALDPIAHIRSKPPLLASGTADFGSSDDFLGGKKKKKRGAVDAEPDIGSSKKRAVPPGEGDAQCGGSLVIAYKGQGRITCMILIAAATLFA